MVYILVRIWAAICLLFFNSRFVIIGMKNIPKKGGVILAPNHQGAFMDAVISGTFLKRKVTFLTRSDIFSKAATPFLSSLGMRPIYRIRDGYQSLAQNEEVFKDCFDKLERGKTILIFPEGNHSPNYYLRPLSKGTSRLALNAREAVSEQVPIYLVPVGINYFSHKRPRTKILLVYGEPINVADYYPLYRENDQKAFSKLREDLTEAMKKVMILPDKTEDYELRKKFVFQKKHEKLSFEEIKKLAAGPISEIKDQEPSLFKRAMESLFGVFNLLPLFLLKQLMKKVKDRAFFISIKCFAGSVIFLIWWIFLYAIGNLFLGWEMGLLLVIVSIQFAFARQELIGYRP